MKSESVSHSAVSLQLHSFPSPADPADRGIKPGSPALWTDPLLPEPPGSPPRQLLSKKIKNKELGRM